MAISLILGGVRSGKSLFAEELLRADGGPVAYVATNGITDEEMLERIRLHRERRPSSWRLIEEPYDLGRILEETGKERTVLVDSLSAWVANRLLSISEEMLRDPKQEEWFFDALNRFLKEAKGRRARYILVSDEVGLGGVALTPMGRRFADLLGEMNQQAASYADEVIFLVAGFPMRIKGK